MSAKQWWLKQEAPTSVSRSSSRELQHEYTDARYVTNPDFTEFSQLIKYVTAQQELITDYIKSPSFKKDCKTDYGDDENDSADGDER